MQVNAHMQRNLAQHLPPLPYAISLPYAGSGRKLVQELAGYSLLALSGHCLLTSAKWINHVEETDPLGITYCIWVKACYAMTYYGNAWCIFSLLSHTSTECTLLFCLAILLAIASWRAGSTSSTTCFLHHLSSSGRQRTGVVQHTHKSDPVKQLRPFETFGLSHSCRLHRQAGSGKFSHMCAYLFYSFICLRSRQGCAIL